MAVAYQGEPVSPILSLRVNPFKSRFIYRTPPSGDSARSQSKYDNVRGKNLFLKIHLLGKGLSRGFPWWASGLGLFFLTRKANTVRDVQKSVRTNTSSLSEKLQRRVKLHALCSTLLLPKKSPLKTWLPESEAYFHNSCRSKSNFYTAFNLK